MVCKIVLMRLFQLLSAASAGSLPGLTPACDVAHRLAWRQWEAATGPASSPACHHGSAALSVTPTAMASALSFLLRACRNPTQNAIPMTSSYCPKPAISSACPVGRSVNAPV